MSSPAFGSPEWSAAKDFAVLMLLTGGNRYAAQELWLRKVRIHKYRPAPPSLQSAPPIPHTPYRQTHADRYERPSLSSPPLPHTSRN